MLAGHRIDFQDGFDGWIAIELFYSGCKRALDGHPCEGCHNPWLWDFSTDTGVTRKTLSEMCEKQKAMGSRFDGIILVGGEPLDQDPADVLSDIETIRSFFGDIPVLAYCGYDDFPVGHPLLPNISWLKIGSYNPTVPPRPGCRLASGNQRVYRVENGKCGDEVSLENPLDSRR